MASSKTKSQLRVCLWSPLPPPIGGIGRWAQRYVAAAPDHGIDVEVVNISPPPYARSERSGVRVDRLLPAVRALKQLATALRHRRPAICHVTTSLFWATPRDALALAMCRAAHVPTVLHIHGSNQMISWRNDLSPLARSLVDHTLRQATCVLTLSHELQDYLRTELPGLVVERVGNMVAADAETGLEPILPPRARGSDGMPMRPRVLFVGSVMPLKGVTELAQAALGLPDVELAIVGALGSAIDPVMMQAMQHALADLRATGRLLEVGELTPKEVMRAYLETDVFCLPSWREGLPNVVLEAMASGVPCVVTPVGAIPDVIAGDLAEVVPVGDAETLRETLARLLADPARQADLAKRGQASVLERYGVDVIMAQYRALYDGLPKR